MPKRAMNKALGTAQGLDCIGIAHFLFHGNDRTLANASSVWQRSIRATDAIVRNRFHESAGLLLQKPACLQRSQS